jgi:SET and MYND domain-containing protein
LGGGGLACRAIKAGEVVIAEQAVAFVPRSQDHTAVCHACCKDLGHNSVSFECPVCKHVVYCQVNYLSQYFS